MKRYPKDETKEIPWTKYKIVVPTKKDKKELLEASKHIHDSNIDTGYITVSQVAGIYDTEVEDTTIIVNKDLYESL